ncbi:Alpha-amylase domain [Rhizoctonia solani]|uniref:Alpha-amylase domain n=1 Tax=Rhizoctonia solani TaxID=456999 RepID=A0A8H7M8Y5_9AGAM|nr:Alpha-amylase domain [Rhizoctonia solani]
MPGPLSSDAFKSYCVYQIYPASFADANGDGIGDLAGIESKLEYIKRLGADVVWLSPIYRSPQKDMGYDISDYQDIDPTMDLVVNHTSDQEAPNNWAGLFGGSAWEWDDSTQEYYLHLFAIEQPDLNWENPEVRQAVWKLMRWWMDKGCDGFRMDVINMISKVPGLPDAPVTQPDREYQSGANYFCNGPHVHEYIQEMNQEVLSRMYALSVGLRSTDRQIGYPNYFTVGESPLTHDPRDLLLYVLPERKELQMMFQFELADVDGTYHPLIPRNPRLSEIKSVINKWQTFMFNNGGWNSLYMENHDQARRGNWSDQCPKGMGIEEYKDIATINFYNETGTDEPNMSDIMDGINRKARDNARVPMQWDDSAHAGFTSGKPWMRVNDNYKQINAKSQIDDERSIFSFWKKMIAVRKEYPLLVHGDFILLAPEDEKIFVYTREHNGEKVLVLMNFSRDEVDVTLPESLGTKARFIVGNLVRGEPKFETRTMLKPYEGQVWLLSS